MDAFGALLAVAVVRIIKDSIKLTRGVIVALGALARLCIIELLDKTQMKRKRNGVDLSS